MDTTTLLIFIAITLPVSATLTLLPAFPMYRRTHDAIASGRISPEPGMSTADIVFLTPEGRVTGQGQYAVYFRSTGDIRLLGGEYLHNSPVTFLSPYSLYWLVRTKALVESKIHPKTPTKKHDSKAT